MGETANPWSGLRTESRNGVLELQPGVIEGLVNATIDVRAVVNTAKGHVDKVNKLKPFVDGIDSSAALAERFSAKGRDLGTILDDHLKILDDMGDTFLAAGKAYTGTDDGSKTDLAALRARIDSSKDKRTDFGAPWGPADLKKENDHHTPSGKEKTAQPDWKEVGSLKDSNYGLPSSLSSPGKSLTFDSQAARAEEPEAYSYDHYHSKIIPSIMNGSPAAPIVAAQAASDWRWLASKLNEGFGTLSNKMTATENAWRSPNNEGGAARAQKAIAAYGTGNDNLVESMRAVGDALEYVSEWLYTTGAALATEDATPVGSPSGGMSPAAWEEQYKRTRKAGFVRIMENTYVPGLNTTAKVIAVLPDPIPPTTGDRPTQTGGGTSTSAGGGSGSGSGSGSSGAAAAALQQGLSALSQAAQSAAQQAAQSGSSGSGTSAAEQASSAAEQISSALQSGLEQAGSAVQSGLEQASSAAQTAADQASSGLSGLSSLPGMSGLSDLQEQAKKAMSAAGKGGGGGGGAGAGGGGAGSGPQALDAASRLFPRASVATAGLESVARAGVASSASSPMGGMPMSPMGGAGAGGQQQKEHKRAEYLDSVEHLEEALGAAPIVARPVVEQ
ncbi:hypothetical protein [Nocardia thailandica]|uniref:hypothetical protein n=1 Tax=Nocardia thailandica TaxID=257275 RepID=UPI0002DDEC66|nr:hypothetical protein [Nocardia thailandica]